MTISKTHVVDKHKIQKKIEAIMQLAGQSADTSDLDEWSRYLPFPGFTSVVEWAFLVQLVEATEQNLRTSLETRQALLAGARAIAEAAGIKLASAAAQAPKRAAS